MLNDKQKSVLLLVVFAGVVGLILIGYFYFIMGRGMINSNKKITAETQEKIETARAEINEIESLLARKDEIQARAIEIQKLARRLPNRVDAPGFLDAVLKMLELTSIVHQEVVSELAQADRPDLFRIGYQERLTKLLANKTSCDIYTEIPYIVKGYGRFHAFSQFINAVEQNPNRFMRLRYLRISNSDDRPSMHPVELVMATFMFNNQIDPQNGGERL